jgi:hypothetical protein
MTVVAMTTLVVMVGFTLSIGTVRGSPDGMDMG